MTNPLSSLFSIKASTPEAFDTLVSKIEAIAQRNPAYYRRRLRLLAVLGYAYIIAVFILLFIALWLLRSSLIAIQGEAMLGELNIVFILAIAGFLSLFFIPFKAPTGIPLTREQVPQLFQVLDDLSTALKAPKLDTVILDAELNAAIMQRPKFGLIGWHTNYLLLGLPLMQALSPEQFKAVLAHELAHLCGDDGRVAAWIYRIRRTWFELAEQFEQNRRGGLFFRRFFSWYGPFFKAYSFVHARSQEYEADRRAAELVGAQHKAEALIWLGLNSSLLSQKFLPRFKQRSQNLSQPPDDYVSDMLATLSAEIDAAECDRWLSLRLANQSDNASTHPCLSDRLNALGYKVSTPLPPRLQRATVLLSERLAPLTQQLDQLWQKEQQKSWQMLKERYDYRLKRFEYLKNKPEKNKQETSLTLEERIKRASMCYALEDKTSVLRTFESLLQVAPDHPTINYWVGYLRIEQGKASGVDRLKQVVDSDPALAAAAYRQLYAFAKQQQQIELAETYRQQGQAQEKMWTLALEERQRRNSQIQFEPHNLPDDEVRQLVEHFASYTEVKAVYAARQVMPRFPQHDYTVIAVARRFYKGMGQGYKTDHQLVQIFEDAIALSQDHSIHIITQTDQWPQLRKLKGALLYSYSPDADPDGYTSSATNTGFSS